MTRILSLAVLMVSSLAVDTIAQSESRAAGQLTGAWRLVSWQEKLASGEVRPSRFTAGSIIYSDSGRMCAQLMDPQRPKLSQTATDAEIRAAYQGFVAYCGRYEIHAEGFVIHHVEFDKSPNIIGRERKRWFTFETPNRLSLRIDRAELGQGLAESTLVWERVTK